MEVSPKRDNRSKAKSKQSHKNLKRKIRSGVKQLAILSSRVEILRQQKLQMDENARKLQLENEMLKAQLSQTRTATAQPNETLEAFCKPVGVRNHTFGARMIALCVNLANRIAFRAVPETLSMVFEALGISIKVPSHDSVEHWCKRIGLHQIRKQPEHHDDMLWIVDHSNQIGQDKLLIILGIRASELPPPGETLSLDQLTVLAIVPGKNWKRDDVRNAYKKVAKRCGTPRFVVCDGAVELRETVDVLETAGKTVIVLRDFKHVAANLFEKLIGKTDRFQAFISQMGTTRSRVQQTELAHLNPPGLKTKSRFMNIAPIVGWSELVLFALDNPKCDAVAGIDRARLIEKLGWVRGFRKEIKVWSQCCELVGCSLEWINKQGLCQDSGGKLEANLRAEMIGKNGKLANQLQKSLVELVNEHAVKLETGERAWLSSEAIESVFGLYKRREGQHSRSGFTGLVASIPTMLKKWSPTEVREALKQTTNEDVRRWTKENIGQTVAGRRNNAYKEMKKNGGKLADAA